MRVLLAAGGTAGHINPALAIAGEIKRRAPDADIHFAGRREGMEYGLVTKAGYTFHHIQVQGIQRSLTPANLLRNAKAAALLLAAPSAARRILKQLRPDVVIGAGGYVSGPVLREAARKKYPTAIHEQNAFPGVTNRLLAKDVDLVFAPGQAAADRLAQPAKTVVTGNPVRPALFTQDRRANREKLGVKDGRVVLLSYGGSLGAMKVNEAVAKLAAWHLKNRDFLHIHATGRIEAEDFARMARQMGIAEQDNFVIREYIDDMPALLSAADLVICRAGAITLAELAAVGRASVLIPSPNVAENHQYYNALEFEKAGAARVFEEKDLGGEALIQAVDALTQSPASLREMGEKATALAHPEALDTIVDNIFELLERRS